MKTRILSSFQVIAFVATASIHTASADSATWNGTTDAVWATSTNWSSDPNPVPGAGNTATFATAGGLDDVINLGTGVTIGSIIFDTSAVAAYTLGSDGVGAQSLTLEDAGTVSLASTINANQTVNANVTLGLDGAAQSYSITNSDSSNSIFFAGTVSGATGGTAGNKILNVTSASSGGVYFPGLISDGGATSLGIVKRGSGLMTLSTVAHTFSGGLAVEAGILNIGGSGSANNSTITLGAATNTGTSAKVGVVNSGTNPSSPLVVVDQTSGAATSRILGTGASTSGQWSGAITMNDAFTVGAFNTNGTNVYNFTLNAGASVNLNSNTLSLTSSTLGSVIANGIISGSGAVTTNNTSTGIIILGANNDYTGLTTISAGTLQIGNGGSTGSISNTSGIVNSGTLVFKRTGSLSQGGPISGTGPVQVAGTANVTFDQANTFSGATTIGSGGKITVATGGSIAPATGATLTLGASSGSGTLQYNSAQSSKFGVINIGTGTSQPGTLNQTSGTILGTSMSLNNGFSGTGAGTVSLSGGTMTLSGAATISNQTTSPSIQSVFTISGAETTFNVGSNLRLTGSGVSSGVGRAASGKFVQDGGTVNVAGSNGLWLTQGYNAENTNTRVGEYQLNGGVLQTNTITSTSNSITDATASFFFNGGILRPTLSNPNFWNSNSQTTASVKDGGAKIDSNGFDITITQPLLNFAGSTTDTLTKDGGGKLTLAGANTYTGATTVNSGTLAVTGSLAETAVEVKSGATLAGSGSLGGGVVIRSGGRQEFAVAAAAASQATRTIAGALTLEAGNLLTLTAAATPSPGASYVLVTATGGITGTPGTATLNGLSGTVIKNGNNLEFTVAAPGGFSSWAATPAFGLVLADQDPTDDPDHDGMENMLEYVLNGNPSTSDSSILPDLDVSGSNFVFTFSRREDSASDTKQVFQYGSDLSGWTSLNITDPAAAGVAIGTAVAGIQPVTVTISKELAIGGKLFGRIQVIKNP